MPHCMHRLRSLILENVKGLLHKDKHEEFNNFEWAVFFLETECDMLVVPFVLGLTIRKEWYLPTMWHPKSKWHAYGRRW